MTKDIDYYCRFGYIYKYYKSRLVYILKMYKVVCYLNAEIQIQPVLDLQGIIAFSLIAVEIFIL